MIFLDSSFLVSVEVEADQNHERAIGIRDEIIKGKFGKAVISDYIFDETVTVTFGRTKDLKKTVLVGTGLRESAEMLKIDDENFEDAWSLFKKQKTTKFSFTDCSTIAVMKAKDIKNIATFDKDFAKVKNLNVIGFEQA